MGFHKDGWRDQAVRKTPEYEGREFVEHRLRTGPGWSFDGTPYPASVQLRSLYYEAVSALVWADGGDSNAPGWAEACARFDAHVERVPNDPERPHSFFIELPGESDGAPPVRVSLDGAPTAVYMGRFHQPHPWVHLTRAEVVAEFRAAYCDRTPPEWREAVERAIAVTAPVAA